MTEAEITVELGIISSAITNIALTGQRYEIGTGPSKRVFEAADLNDLISYRSSLENQLKDATGNSGMSVGF